MIEGSCHCGTVEWKFTAALESATACNCTLCRRYGALWAYSYLNHGISATGNTKAYSRGRKLNGFHFCENCGCLAYYLANSKNQEGQYRMAVNLRMANDPLKIQALPIDHFEGLETFEDLPRDGRCIKDLWF